MTQWYYVDRTHTRQGPVTAGALAMAYGQGQLDDSGLVWREGLAEWAPLGQFREELGLPPASPAAAPPPAPPAPAPASIKRGTGCLIAAAVAGVVGLFLIAILAAIALPAYQQYITRAKVATAVAQARALQVSVDEFVANVDRCPRDAEEVQMALPNPPGVAAITLGEANTGMCYIELELSAEAGFAELAGQRIRLSRDSDGGWYCTSDTPQTQVLPSTCR
jgi:type IV pilus assembly protein PilA